MNDTPANARRSEAYRLAPARSDGISVDCTKAARNNADSANHPQEPKAGYATLPNWSYRDMWWVSDYGTYSARGIHGQVIYVDPKAEMTIVRYASHPAAGNAANDPVSLPAYRGLAEWLTKND